MKTGAMKSYSEHSLETITQNPSLNRQRRTKANVERGRPCECYSRKLLGAMGNLSNADTASEKDTHLQILVPKTQVEDVLRLFHDGISGGLPGVKQIRQRFYWINSRVDMEDWCRKCTYKLCIS